MSDPRNEEHQKKTRKLDGKYFELFMKHPFGIEILNDLKSKFHDKELVKDAKASIDNLGKSLEEIIESFEEKL